MPRLRSVTAAACGLLLVATAVSLWMTAWPRWHDQATEASVAARAPRGTPVPRAKTKHRAAASASHSVPQAAPRSPPRAMYAPSPRYPMQALRRGVEGRVLLRVHVDAGGVVQAVSIAASSGDPSLDAAARTAVRQWRFEPPAGARAMTFDLPLRFRIRAP